MKASNTDRLKVPGLKVEAILTLDLTEAVLRQQDGIFEAGGLPLSATEVTQMVRTHLQGLVAENGLSGDVLVRVHQNPEN